MESGRKKLYLPYLHRGKKRNDKKQQNKNHSILGGCSPAKPKEHPCTSSFKKKKKNHRSTMSSFQMLSNDLVDLSLLLLPQLCYPNIKRSSSEITLFHPSQTLFSSTTPGYVALLSHFSLSWKRCRLFGTPYQVAARRIKGCHFR